MEDMDGLSFIEPDAEDNHHNRSWEKGSYKNPRLAYPRGGSHSLKVDIGGNPKNNKDNTNHEEAVFDQTGVDDISYACCNERKNSGIPDDYFNPLKPDG